MSAGLETGRAGRHPVLRQVGPLLVIGVSCLALAFGGEEARQWGRYEREGLEAGQWWRLVTAHLVHLDWAHLWLNLLGLALLGVLLWDVLTGRQWLASAAAGVIGINLGLYLFVPHVEWYVGLSGVLHAMLAWGAVRLLEHRAPLGGLLAAALIAKLAWEQWAGPMPFSGTGPVIVEAHLYGGAAGACARLVLLGGREVRRRRTRGL